MADMKQKKVPQFAIGEKVVVSSSDGTDKVLSGSEGIVLSGLLPEVNLGNEPGYSGGYRERYLIHVRGYGQITRRPECLKKVKPKNLATLLYGQSLLSIMKEAEDVFSKLIEHAPKELHEPLAQCQIDLKNLIEAVDDILK